MPRRNNPIKSNNNLYEESVKFKAISPRNSLLTKSNNSGSLHNINTVPRNSKIDRIRETPTMVQFIHKPIPMLKYLIKHGETPKQSIKKMDSLVKSLSMANIKK
jgi:hypothetical protein